MVYGEVPREPCVFAACDFHYFKEHAPSLVYSCNDIGKNVHIHIAEPDQESFNITNILNNDTSVNTTFSFSGKQNMGRSTRAYYACLRFFMLPSLLPSAQKILTVDVDCLFMKPFEFPKTATGYFPRKPIPNTVGWEQEGTKVAAGVVYMDNRAIPVAEAVIKRIEQGPIQWFIDQVALAETFARVEEKEITQFDSTFMDWEFEEESVMWTGKGDRKFANEKYVAKKKEFNRLPSATKRCWL